jgi:hypothetical protein
VIVFKNETYDKDFFAGRIEWNWTEDISEMNKNNVNGPIKSWGFFKNTSYEYNWLVGNGTGGQCNASGTQFAIDDDEDVGTAATRTPTTDGITCTQQGTSPYSYCSIDSTRIPLNQSCVAIYYDCTKIYIYRYDKRSNPNFAYCGNSRYINEANFTPGQDSHTLTLNVYAPYGIPASPGSLNTSTFTVYATAA